MLKENNIYFRKKKINKRKKKQPGLIRTDINNEKR